MGFIVGLLTFFLVLDCVVLILLVLVQLPKKESGAGLAFGGGASDALFGAGSGTVLSKVTKYAAASFFVLAFGLAIIQRYRSTASTTEFERQLAKPATSQTIPAKPPGTAPTASVVTTPEAPTATTPTPSAPAVTNLLSAPATTNAPAK